MRTALTPIARQGNQGTKGTSKPCKIASSLFAFATFVRGSSQASFKANPKHKRNNDTITTYRYMYEVFRRNAVTNATMLYKPSTTSMRLWQVFRDSQRIITTALLVMQKAKRIPAEMKSSR
mmetsp:Transcript_26578/g.58251  ORF Transcript_26578/g.58251 Transcript_26578/m.58251 type:complete len:121 (-) Transcript_26578:698-1060(-)